MSILNIINQCLSRESDERTQYVATGISVNPYAKKNHLTVNVGIDITDYNFVEDIKRTASIDVLFEVELFKEFKSYDEDFINSRIYYGFLIAFNDVDIYEIFDEDDKYNCVKVKCKNVESNDGHKLPEDIEVRLSVKPEHVNNMLESLEFKFAVIDTTTICKAILPNGFTVGTGESACVDPKNFNKELGERYAKERAKADALNELWKLEGYLLKVTGRTSDSFL